MRTRARADLSKARVALIVAMALMLAGPQVVLATEVEENLAADFEENLSRVDRALEENPSHVLPQVLQACAYRRNDAVRLYRLGYPERAQRRLKACVQALKIAAVTSEPVERQEEEQEEAPPSIEEIQARAAREIERALTLKPDVVKGLEIYRTCAECHMPEAWGQSALIPIPQLAGQHRTVVIKQLADIRAGNRESVVMAPYATVELIGGAQAIADVAGYIDSLEMSVDNGKGPGKDLELGAQLYSDNCARCHGPTGEGNSDAYVPRIQAQHYQYLVLEFDSIRKGKRRNANPEMAIQIGEFSARQIQAVLDHVSRLEPAEELRAPPGWHNPDFAH
jgi:cytochrome c553